MNFTWFISPLIGLISQLSQLFVSLWNSLDEETKKKIIERIVTAMEELIRTFYRDYNSRGEN